MADDSMDVLPDQGRDAGNEDIDIDIDLTAAQADEDDILEDAEPDRDYGESLQNFQDNDGKDDPMADDDASSYIMDDADTRTDLRDSDQDRPKSPPYTDEQHQMGFEQKLQEEQTAIWQSKSNHTEVPQHGTGANTSQTSSVTKESHKPLETLMGPEKDSDSASALSGGYVPTETESRGSDAVENLRTTRSDFVADKTDVDDVANVESHSTLTHTSVTLADHSPPGREAGDTIAEQGAEYVELINQGYDRIIQKEELKALAQEHSPVEVCFNDRIYPLVRTSDSDDPDNFFFEDYGYAELALVDFFKGLRDVLRVYFDVDRDETDYEIHVIIKSLGVQMNEVC